MGTIKSRAQRAQGLRPSVTVGNIYCLETFCVAIILCSIYIMTTRRRRKKTKRKQKGKMVRVDFFKSRIIPRWPSGFLPRFTTKLKYCQSLSLDAGIVLADRNSFRANGIFDPDVSVGGHQPLYHDELFNVYGLAAVLGSKLTCQWAPNRTTNVAPGAIILWKDTVAGDMDLFSFSTMMEQSSIPPNHYSMVGLLNSTGNARNILTITYSPKRDMGFNNPSNEESLRCTASANPTREYFFDVMYIGTDDAVNPGQVQLLITIEYLVEFYNLNSQLQN